jgi:glycosyltransferase involved in cell wall biosynthesis
MASKVSILLPFRDAADTIEEAVQSVLRDEPEHDVELELIAIDDGSTDDGVARVRALGDPRVHLVSSAGRGIADAVATGLERARGRFIARMDADDVSLPGRFSAQLAALAEDDRLAVVGTRVEAFPTCGEGMALYLDWQNGLVTPEDHARELFIESPLCNPSTLAKREALDDVGGWRASTWPEDYDLWMRLDARGWKLAKVPKVFLRWRQRPNSVTFTHAMCRPEQLVAAKAHYLAPKITRSGRALVVWGAGPTGKRLARALEGEGVRAARFVDIDPRKLGRTRRGAPVVSSSTIDPARDLVVVAVGTRGARAIIRAELEARGLREGVDFLCAA